MSNIAIYARKSTESEDRQILSIDSQVRELKEHAQREGLVISYVLTESKSAKAPGRPVFNELFALVQGGQVDGVLCWKLDRLARNPVDGGAVIWAMEERKLATIYSPQRAFTNTSNDKFWMQLEFGMAKKYVDDLSDNVKRGLRAKIASGWMPGLPPLGYLNDRNERTIVRDPERFVIVRKMWHLMLGGHYTPRRILEIASSQWGLRMRKFKRTGGGLVHYSTVYQIFTNPFYHGSILYNHELCPGMHEPMVSKSEFDRVQELLGLRSRPRPKKYTFAFTGLIRCGECGASITAEHKTNRRYGYKYVYYHCTHRKRAVRCQQKVIERAAIEKQISNFLGSLTISREIRDWTFQVLRELDQEEHHIEATTTESLARRHDACQKEIKGLIDLRLRGLLNDDEYLAKKNELESERVRLRELIDGSEGKLDRVFKACQGVFDLALLAKSKFNKGSADEKSEILRNAGSNLVLKDRILNIQAQKPLNLVQQALRSGNAKRLRFKPREFGQDKTKTPLNKSDMRTWFSLVKDVRTFYLENPTAPTLNQAFERPIKRTPPDPSHIREFKQYQQEVAKEQRAVVRLFRVYQHRVQSPDLPVPRKRAWGRSVPSPNGPRSGSSNRSGWRAPAGSGGAPSGSGIGGDCSGTP